MSVRYQPLTGAARKPCVSLAGALMFIASGASGTVVLHDQTGNCTAGNVISTQSLGNPIFDSEAADDVFVPAGQAWDVTQVYALGSFSGTAQSINVQFYADDGGKPGSATPGCTFNGITPFGNVSGALTIDLLSTCVLQGGATGTKFWLAVQPELESGSWYWNENSVLSGSAAQWENPGGGFHTCATWGARTTCSFDSFPDQCFSVSGLFDTIFADGFEEPQP